MDRLRQKGKKEKPSFIDVKSMKENLKIKEILRTVKMNSSMRLKAPPGSKVMDNKDFNDNDDCFIESTTSEDLEINENNAPSATNPNVITGNNTLESVIEQSDDTDKELPMAETSAEIGHSSETINISTENLENKTEYVDDLSKNHSVNSVVRMAEIPIIKIRDRKLSLDQTLLIRQGGLSQSEVDLHSIGKSPLERKSSFFRKKMDSFFRNTTELFKKQSFRGPPQDIQRRGSMSVSLQSLNKATSDHNNDFTDEGLLQSSQDVTPGSMTSLNSSSTIGRSASSVSVCHSEAPNPGQLSDQGLVSSQPTLHVTHTLGDHSSNSVHSLNEADLQDSFLHNRAISMSSGLDSQSWMRRKKSSTNRSNRVTWVASEGLTNYFRRMIQDEKSKDIQESQSHQDLTGNKSSSSKQDSKGRRLSYQRAVSGEDPSLTNRYQDSSLRRKHTTREHSEVCLLMYIFKGVKIWLILILDVDFLCKSQKNDP